MLKIAGLDRRHTSLVKKLMPTDDREWLKVGATVIHFGMPSPDVYVARYLNGLDPQWREYAHDAGHARLSKIMGPRQQVILLARVWRRVMEALAEEAEASVSESEPAVPNHCFACDAVATERVDTGAESLRLCAEHFYALPGNRPNGEQIAAQMFKSA